MIAADYYPDTRRRRCGRCGVPFVPPGAGNGMCSDACWMGARGRQVPQNAGLTRAALQLSVQSQAHLNNYRPQRVQADVPDARTVARYLAERREGLAVIGRAKVRSRRGSVVSRTEHTGPDCAVCAAGRALEIRR